MVFCIVFSGNNYLNETHDQNIAANGNHCIDMARAGHTSNPPINSSNQSINASVCHGATASVSSSSPSTSAMTTTSTKVTATAGTTSNAIPTTIDGLIEFIAINGDEFEENILTEITQMNEPTLFR